MSTLPYPVRLIGGDDLERSRLTVLLQDLPADTARDRAVCFGRSPRRRRRHRLVRGALHRPRARRHAQLHRRLPALLHARRARTARSWRIRFRPSGPATRIPSISRSTRRCRRTGGPCSSGHPRAAVLRARVLRAAAAPLPDRDRLLVRRAVHGARPGRPPARRPVLPALQQPHLRVSLPGQSALSGLRRETAAAAVTPARARSRPTRAACRPFRSPAARSHPSG